MMCGRLGGGCYPAGVENRTVGRRVWRTIWRMGGKGEGRRGSGEGKGG